MNNALAFKLFFRVNTDTIEVFLIKSLLKNFPKFTENICDDTIFAVKFQVYNYSCFWNKLNKPDFPPSIMVSLYYVNDVAKFYR